MIATYAAKGYSRGYTCMKPPGIGADGPSTAAGTLAAVSETSPFSTSGVM